MAQAAWAPAPAASKAVEAAATRLGFVRADKAEVTLEAVGKLKMGRGKK